MSTQVHAPATSTWTWDVDNGAVDMPARTRQRLGLTGTVDHCQAVLSRLDSDDLDATVAAARTTDGRDGHPTTVAVHWPTREGRLTVLVLHLSRTVTPSGRPAIMVEVTR